MSASQKLYVGNLPWRATEEDFRELFSGFEPIHSLSLVIDPETQLSRGYGFAELDEPQAEAAIQALDKSTFMGRTLRVCKSETREYRERAPNIPDYCMREPYARYGNDMEPMGWSCWSRGCGVCPLYRGRCGFGGHPAETICGNMPADYHRYKCRNDIPRYHGLGKNY